MFLKKAFKFEKIFFKYAKLVSFNYLKFNNILLNLRDLGLNSFLQNIYDKNVEIKAIELKSIHLNSDIFSKAVAFKLKDRKKKTVKILRKAVLNFIRIPIMHTLIINDDQISNINENNILDVIKQQIISGVRFEASGRLTRRLTASRSIFKYRYLGGLRNIRSSYIGKPSFILRGFKKSNLQYKIINSKTRNGSFGLKCWLSSH